MNEKIVVSQYLLSWQKRTFDLFFGSFFLLLALPVMLIICLLILITEGWPIFFVQKRVGKDGELFRMYKFRTMRLEADKEQKKYRNLNEADGPVFKIRNDPRFVGVGRWLSHIGLDELPQLWNVLKGEMSLVGPRPLPADEEKKLSHEILNWRRLIKPGIMSQWIIAGGHNLSLKQWMKLDRNYSLESNLCSDFTIFIKVLLLRFVVLLTI